MDVPGTPVTRMLDAQGIAYRVLPHAEPVYTMEAAARQRGVVREEMVKAILLRDRLGHYLLACVAGDDRVNPRAVRAQMPADWKRLSFASAEEILAMTGCVQGAVAPLGLPGDVPVIFDLAIAGREKVNISSGDVMFGLELAAADLIRATGAQLAPIAEATGKGGYRP